MKKILFSMACLMMLGMQSVMAVTAQIALRHQGNVTQFNPDALPSAIEAAEDGDTILLSAGTFKYSGNPTTIRINKAITIVGCGAEKTVIDNALYVSIPDSPTLTAHLLDGVTVTTQITVELEVTGLKFRKCIFNGVGFSGTYNTHEMLIDRCKTGIISLKSTVMGLTVMNSESTLYGVPYTPDAVVFSNSNVFVGNGSSGVAANFINCYITGWYPNMTLDANSAFTNCLASAEFWEKYNALKKENCYTYTASESEVDQAEYFKQQGWLGTDGTIVGMYGGATPFTLEPNAPKVTDYTIGVDTKTRTLNVKMTLSAN